MAEQELLWSVNLGASCFVCACEMTTRCKVVRCGAAAGMLNATHHSRVHNQHGIKKKSPVSEPLNCLAQSSPNLIKSCQVPAKAKSAFWQRINLKNLRNIQIYLQQAKWKTVIFVIFTAWKTKANIVGTVGEMTGTL